MDKLEELKQWFRLAKQNVDLAKLAACKMHPMPVELICYNCQQSGEKDLKGYLFHKDVDFPRTHDLTTLLDICVDVDPDFSRLIKQCRYLTRYGVMP